MATPSAVASTFSSYNTSNLVAMVAIPVEKDSNEPQPPYYDEWLRCVAVMCQEYRQLLHKASPIVATEAERRRMTRAAEVSVIQIPAGASINECRLHWISIHPNFPPEHCNMADLQNVIDYLKDPIKQIEKEKADAAKFKQAVHFLDVHVSVFIAKKLHDDLKQLEEERAKNIALAAAQTRTLYNHAAFRVH